MSRASLRCAVRAVVLGCVLTACGDDGPSVPPPDVPTGPTTPSSLEPAAAGRGELVIDGVRYLVDVAECRTAEAGDPGRGVPVELFGLTGGGEGPGDEPFTLEITRILVRADTDTFTDVIDFEQRGVGLHLVAERAESDGVIFDLRDPTATATLLRLGDGHVDGAGTFGRVGGTDDDRTLPGIVSAGCPVDDER